MYGFPYLSVSSMQVSPPVLEKWFLNPQVLLLTRQHTNPTDVPPLPASPQRNNVQSQRIHTSMCQAITVHPHHPVSSTSPSTAMFRLHRLFSAWFRQWPCNSSQPLMTLPEKTFRQCQADSLNGPSQTTIVSEPAMQVLLGMSPQQAFSSSLHPARPILFSCQAPCCKIAGGAPRVSPILSGNFLIRIWNIFSEI